MASSKVAMSICLRPSRAESSAASVFCRALASTTTSSCWIASGASAVSNGSRAPTSRVTPSIRLVAYERARNWSV